MQLVYCQPWSLRLEASVESASEENELGDFGQQYENTNADNLIKLSRKYFEMDSEATFSPGAKPETRTELFFQDMYYIF
jgi:hypothetical protein